MGAERKPRQKLQPVQAYSLMFWESRLRDIVEPRWHAHLAANPHLTKKDRLAFQNRLLLEMLRNETASVREDVEQFRQLKASADGVGEDEGMGEILEGEEGLQEEERVRRQNAREIQAYVLLATGVVALFH